MMDTGSREWAATAISRGLVAIVTEIVASKPDAERIWARHRAGEVTFLVEYSEWQHRVVVSIRNRHSQVEWLGYLVLKLPELAGMVTL